MIWGYHSSWKHSYIYIYSQISTTSHYSFMDVPSDFVGFIFAAGVPKKELVESVWQFVSQRDLMAIQICVVRSLSVSPAFGNTAVCHGIALFGPNWEGALGSTDRGHEDVLQTFQRAGCNSSWCSFESGVFSSFADLSAGFVFFSLIFRTQHHL